MADRKKPKGATTVTNSEFYELLQHMDSKLSTVRDSVSSLDKKVDLHVQKTAFEFQAIRKLDEEQNLLLKEHHDRSTQLKRDNDLKEAALRQEALAQRNELRTEIQGVRARVSKLETPAKWFTTTIRVIITIGGIATAIYTVLRVLGVTTGAL